MSVRGHGSSLAHSNFRRIFRRTSRGTSRWLPNPACLRPARISCPPSRCSTFARNVGRALVAFIRPACGPPTPQLCACEFAQGAGNGWRSRFFERTRHDRRPTGRSGLRRSRIWPFGKAGAYREPRSKKGTPENCPGACSTGRLHARLLLRMDRGTFRAR